MEKKIYLIRAEVKPLKGCLMFGKATGAFVNCVAYANNKRGASQFAENALKEDLYEVVSIDEVISFSDLAWKDDEEAVWYKSLAWDAYSRGLVGYGKFNCWDKERTKSKHIAKQRIKVSNSPTTTLKIE